jgi:hypothetical protein
MRFSTNSEGYRGPERTNSPLSVLFLGDSFTMGYGVSDGAEFPALIGVELNEALKDVSVDIINAGVGGNGNGQWIKFLDRHLNDVRPQLVVMQFMQNDFDDNVRERYFSVTDQDTLVEEVISLSWARVLEDGLSRIPVISESHFYAALREVYYHWKSSSPIADSYVGNQGKLEGASPIGRNELPYPYRLTQAIISEAIRRCKSSESVVIALLVGLHGSELEMVRDWFETHNVRVVSIPARSERPDLYFETDGHWNEAGHQFAVELLSQSLIAHFSQMDQSAINGH